MRKRRWAAHSKTMRCGLELSFESDRLLFGVGVVRHRDVLFIVDIDFAQDSSVRFDEHAIVANGSEFEYLTVVATGGNRAIVVGCEIEIRADNGVTDEEFDHVDDEPIGEHEELVGRKDGEAPHDECLEEDVATDALVDVVEKTRCRETTKTTVENAAQDDRTNRDLKKTFHRRNPLLE